MLTPLYSALAFSLRIISSGFTLSKFKSKMMRAGLALAFTSTSSSSLTNSTDIPARLAASFILTEKNRSLTTARIFLLPCFCIQFGYSNSSTDKLQAGLVFGPDQNSEGRFILLGSQMLRKRASAQRNRNSHAHRFSRSLR